MENIQQVSEEIIESIEILKKDIEKLQMAFQRFISVFLPEDEPSKNEIEIIDEAEKDFVKGEYISLENFLKELK